MKKYLAILIIALVPTLVQAEVNCSAHPIYCDIVKLKPKIDKKFAMELSNYIYNYSKKYGTDPTISVAIAMQESSFANVNRPGAVLTESGKIVRGSTDLGVFQIHINTIADLRRRGYDIDVDQLQSDVEYQTYWHTRILKMKIKECTENREKFGVVEGNEWSCYHSFTYKKRKIYLKDVGAHLTKITSE